MSKARLNKARAAVTRLVDRRTLGGIFIGAAVMVSALASAESAGNGGFFTGLFSVGQGSSGNGGTDALSQADLAISAQMRQMEEDCHNKEPGTVGYAVANALRIHTELASATPNVESLFDVNSDCFASINQIIDLSSSIPSMQAILSAAQAAVMQYAQKKICTAVNRVTGMVTTPINQAIGNINQMAGFADLNGMANSAVGGAMSGIDPQLGSQYQGAVPAGTYNVNTNPFGTAQTTFDGSIGGNANSGLNNNSAQINALMQQIGALQETIVNDHRVLHEAQDNYGGCTGGGEYANCAQGYAVIEQAQRNLVAHQNQLIELQRQMSSVVTQSGAVVPGTPQTLQTPQGAANGSATASNGNATGSSWWSGIFN